MADFTDEELEEIKRRLRYENPGSKYLDDFGQEISEMQALERYILAHKKELQEEFRAQKQAQDLPQENEATILEGFNELVAKDEWTSSPQEKEQAIEEFLARKDKYFATIPEEQRERINKEIEARLNNQHQEEQYYGNEVYTTSEDFKKRFKAMEAKRQQNSQFKGGKTQEASEIKVYTLANIERYLSLQEEYLARTDDTKNADGKTAFELIHENGQKDLQAFVDGKLVIDSAAYEKMDEFIKVFAGDYKNAEMQALEKAAREKLAQLKERQNSPQENEDTILEAFNELVTKDEWTSSPKEKEDAIEEFLARKERYFATISEEQKERINKEIEARLNNQHQEEQYYGNEVYTTSEDFKKRFKAMEAERRQNTEATQTLDSRRDERVEESKERQTSLEEKQKSRTEENVEDAIVVDEKETKEQALEKEEQDIYRDRSADSDSNEFMLDKLKLQVLLEMGVINQAIYDEGIKSPSAAIEKLQEKRPLKEKEQAEYEARMTIKEVDSEFFEQLPPSELAALYAKLRTQMQSSAAMSSEINEEDQRRFDKVASRIDTLTNEYYSGIRTIIFDQYNYADGENIADIYDGYVEMLAARQPDVDKEQQEKIGKVKGELDKQIKLYEEAWNLDGLTSKDASRMAKNQERLSSQIMGIELNEETKKWLANVKFTDENGQPLPEEESEKRRQTFVDFARNNTIISHLGDKEKVSKEILQTDFQDQLKIQLFQLANVQDSLVAIGRDGKIFAEEDRLNSFVKQMSNIERPLVISEDGYKAGVHSAVNNTMACINRVGKVTGKDSPLLRKLHAPIAKYDERRNDRFSGNGEYKVSWWKTFGYTTGATLASKGLSFGIYKGSAALGMGLGLTASAGIAAVGLSTTGMLLNYRNYKKAMAAKKEKASIKDFITRKPYREQNIASTLGFVAGACLVAGHPELAAIAGMGALGVMGYSTWRDARASGLNKKQAAWQTLKRLSAMTAGAATGSYLGSMFGMTPSTTVEHEGTPTQGQDAYTTHDYSAEEHAWAEGRNSDPRWSEFLNKYHVAQDLQNPSDPNIVSADAMANLKAAINQAIGNDTTFYSDMGDGNLQPNTEMLAYKATQLLYLAPNPDAITTTGAPIGDVLGYTNADGSHVNYIDVIRQAVSSGKVDNPQEFAAMLKNVENVIGGQIGNDVNDMGKITLFGTHDPVSPVQSYNAGADAGYNVNNHPAIPGTVPTTIETVPGHKIFALGYWEPVKETVSKLKERAGALADRLFGRKKKSELEIIPTPIPEHGDKKPELPEHGDKKPELPEHGDKKPELPEHKGPRAALPEHTEIGINEMLDKEYEIVHGIKPDESERLRYKGLVQKEWQVEGTSDNFGRYLQERMNTFEDVLRTRVSVHDDSKGFADTEKGKSHISQTRETMWKTNLSVDGEVLESKDVTLRHFTHLTSLGKNSEDNQKITAARDEKRGPAPKGKADKPHGGVYNISKTVLKAINNRGKSK